MAIPNKENLKEETNFYVHDAFLALKSLQSREDFSYELTTFDYQKYQRLETFPSKAFKIGLREKYCKFKPKRGQVVKVNLGITAGSVLEGVKYGVVVQTDYKNTTSPVFLVAPIAISKKSSTYHVELNDRCFNSNRADLKGSIISDMLRPCSIGACIADESGSYVYGEVSSYGMMLLEKAILRSLGMIHVLDALDGKKIRRSRMKPSNNPPKNTLNTPVSSIHAVEVTLDVPQQEVYLERTVESLNEVVLPLPIAKKKSSSNNKKKKKQKARNRKNK